MQRTAREPVQLAGNQATGTLKLVALLFMFADHAGKMLFPAVPEMRILGRIAFPIYAWCMVVGFHYTRDPLRYAMRVLLVGVLSQPLYMAALDHTWQQPNIFLTLFMALLALMAASEKPWEKQSTALHIGGRCLAAVGLLACLALTDMLKCDYGWRGVLLVVLLYAVRDSSKGIAAVMVAFCLFWGANTSTVARLFGLPIQRLQGTALSLLAPWLRIQALAVLALPFILPRWKERVKLPKWVGYGLYPAHLALLWLLEQVM